MKHLRQRTTLLLVSAAVIGSIFVLTPGNASEEAALLALSQSTSSIQDDQVKPVVCRHCHSSPCCCEPVCCPKQIVEKEEKSSWKVACEYVCVPGFRYPWDKCCGPVCGWVRCVNVLEEHKYECDTCGYEWEVKCVCTNQGHSRKHCKCPRCQRECR